eukprot:14478063-Alexandrium_andersonii.AAC.1
MALLPCQQLIAGAPAPARCSVDAAHAVSRSCNALRWPAHAAQASLSPEQRHRVWDGWCRLAMPC